MRKQLDFDSNLSKRISYIVITKNRHNYLEVFLPKVGAMKTDLDELIIVDGGSNDNSLEVISRYKKFIDLVISEPDKGAAHATNKGLLFARGKYVKYLADDDEIFPEACEAAVKVMEKNPDVDHLVCGGTKIFGRKKIPVYLPPGVDYGKNVEDVFKYGACGAGFLTRRSVFAKVGIYPLSLLADNAFVLGCMKGGAVVKFCRINMFNHPIHSESLIQVNSSSARKELLRLCRDYTSGKFYWRFALSEFLANHPVNLTKLYERLPILRKFLTPLKMLYQGSITIINPKEAVNFNKRGILWDGGFS